MTDSSFVAWWWAHYPKLVKYTEHDLERMQCRDAEIVATEIMEQTYLYFLRICPRIDERHVDSLAYRALHNRALNGLRDAIRNDGLICHVNLDDIRDYGEYNGDFEKQGGHSDIKQIWENEAQQVLSYEDHSDPLAQAAIRRVLAQMTAKDQQLLIDVCIEEKSLDDISKERGSAHRTGPQKAIKKAKERFKKIWNSLGFTS